MTSATVEESSTSFMLMAIEVGEKKWDLGFGSSLRVRRRSVGAWDQEDFKNELARAKKRLGVGPDAPVKACYEAGRVGFSLYRFLCSLSIECVILDSSSIEVNRRAKRAKTDGLDLRQMLKLMERTFLNGEKNVFRQAKPLSPEEEAELRVHRERQRLVKERTAHRARIRSLLALHGIRPQSLAGLNSAELRDWSGAPLPRAFEEEIRRELSRMDLIRQQINVLEREQRERIKAPLTRADEIAQRLFHLRSIGEKTAWLLGKEFFNTRTFKNRKQVGSMAGMVDMPYDSGASCRQQGISKSGNPRVRWAMIELAWSWVRYQPHSALTLWFNERFGHGSSRLRRIGIVALARKLLVALWKYVEFGEKPEGAVFKTH